VTGIHHVRHHRPESVCDSVCGPDVKRDESSLLSPARTQEARALDEKLARLRMARRLRQADTAARAGLARSTAALIEKGDLSRTQAHILRYLEASDGRQDPRAHGLCLAA
jgi:DNA-binding XRE family transcriptional regulator